MGVQSGRFAKESRVKTISLNVNGRAARVTVDDPASPLL